MTYWISDFSYLVLGRVGLVGLVGEFLEEVLLRGAS